MRVTNIGGYKSINSYVSGKIERFKNSDRSFSALFSLMFSEKTNILYERSYGYRMEKTTYGEAYEHILKKRAALSERLQNLPEDAMVGLYMENSLEWIENFWVILSAGFRPVLMNLRLPYEVLTDLLKTCDIQAVVSDSREFPGITVQAEELQKCLSKNEAQSSDTRKRSKVWECAGTDLENGAELSDIRFGSEIFCMSSGTSQHVKICAYSAEQFYHQILDSADIIKKCTLLKKHYKGELKLLAFLPFYHIFGLVAMYIWFGFFSRTFVHLRDLQPSTILTTIRRHQVTHIFAVPLFWNTVYEQAIREIESRGEETFAKFQKGLRISEKISDVPLLGELFRTAAFREVREGLFGDSICFMITGGAAVRPEVMRFFNSIGYHLADGYGMTEIGITSVEISMNQKILCSGSVGNPMSSVEYRVNAEGELEVRGQSTAKYVLSDGVRTELSGEWFQTHDLAELRDGRYYILGRQDELVVSASGENLNPNLIEPKLQMPLVQGTCLLRGASDGAPVLLVSVPGFITEEGLNDVTERMRVRLQELNLSGQIHTVYFMKDPLLLPDEFKLNRIRLRQEYLSGKLRKVTFSADETEAESDELTEEVRNCVSETLGKEPSEIRITEDFFLDLGGSSLEYFALLSELEEKFQVSFPTGESEALSTVREIADYIRRSSRHGN